jgi:hypothetical protein
MVTDTASCILPFFLYKRTVILLAGSNVTFCVSYQRDLPMREISGVIG